MVRTRANKDNDKEPDSPPKSLEKVEKPAQKRKSPKGSDSDEEGGSQNESAAKKRQLADIRKSTLLNALDLARSTSVTVEPNAALATTTPNRSTDKGDATKSSLLSLKSARETDPNLAGPSSSTAGGSETQDRAGGGGERDNLDVKKSVFSEARKRKVKEFMEDRSNHHDYKSDNWIIRLIACLPGKGRVHSGEVTVSDVKRWIANNPQLFEMDTAGAGTSQHSADSSTGPPTLRPRSYGVNLATGSGTMQSTVCNPGTSASVASKLKAAVAGGPDENSSESTARSVPADEGDDDDYRSAASSTEEHGQRAEVLTSSTTGMTLDSSQPVGGLAPVVLSQTTPAVTVPLVAATAANRPTVENLVVTLNERSDDVITTLGQLRREAATNPSPNPDFPTAVENAEHAAQLLHYFVNRMR